METQSSRASRMNDADALGSTPMPRNCLSRPTCWHHSMEADSGAVWVLHIDLREKRFKMGGCSDTGTLHCMNLTINYGVRFSEARSVDEPVEMFAHGADGAGVRFTVLFGRP